MAVLPPFFLDTVAAIGAKKEDDSIAWTASGFLYGQYISHHDATDTEEASTTYEVYLVTNRHVLAGPESIVVRFGSDSNALAPAIQLPLLNSDRTPRYVLHADPDIDVAVLPMNVGLLRLPGTKFSFFQSDKHTMNRQAAIDAELTEGDGAFALGFPMGQVGGDRNYVIVRHGAIARVRDWLSGATKDFLIDATVFPGNSGGPVVTRPTSTSITGTKRVAAAHLIGLVKAYVPYRDVAVSSQTGRPRVTFEENSGLAAVVPLDFIEDAIRQHQASKAPAPKVETRATDESEGPKIDPATAPAVPAQTVADVSGDSTTRSPNRTRSNAPRPRRHGSGR